MIRRWALLAIGLNLVVLIALVFLYPHLMVSPGILMASHAEITTDCFACHAPLRGVSSERCTACHKLDDIGLRTTKGVHLVQKTVKASFHQELIEQNCMACHSDHRGTEATEQSRKPFSHSLLRTEVREQCQTCHKAPADKLHNKISGNCKQCHTQDAWKPATFDHDKLFLLDRDHNVECVICHVKNDYNRYTCYGCHEHTPARVAADHREEGIRDIDKCVRCHRSAEGEGD